LIGWTSNEKKVMEDVLSGEHSRAGLEKFCEVKADWHRKQCSDLMEQVPPSREHATVHAVRASTYAQVLKEIEDALGRE
jgi:hypothetical protein